MPSFKEIEVVSQNGLVKVVLEWIGEGYEGDYDENDPNDAPLIRYSLYRKVDDHVRLNEIVDSENDGWGSVPDGSYCTLLKVTDDREKLIEAAKCILRQVEDGVSSCNREKRLYESLSWLGVEDFK